MTLPQYLVTAPIDAQFVGTKELRHVIDWIGAAHFARLDEPRAS
jgi:hypothetical protein